MKKSLLFLMCCLALAFASCGPDPDPEPIAEPEVANQRFIGYYDGTIYLSGTANAPQFAQLGMPNGYPLDSVSFHLTADITAGSTDNTTNVVFAIINNDESETYETTATVSNNTISFGDLSYTYLYGPTTLNVTLTLTGNLDGGRLNLSGPANGDGQVLMDGIMLDLTVEASVTGQITKQP